MTSRVIVLAVLKRLNKALEQLRTAEQLLCSFAPRQRTVKVRLVALAHIAAAIRTVDGIFNGWADWSNQFAQSDSCDAAVGAIRAALQMAVHATKTGVNLEATEERKPLISSSLKRAARTSHAAARYAWESTCTLAAELPVYQGSGNLVRAGKEVERTTLAAIKAAREEFAQIMFDCREMAHEDRPRLEEMRKTARAALTRANSSLKSRLFPTI